MSAPAHLRRGWCPGALRPMETGDGLLVRLRITGGIVPLGMAEALAEVSRRFGNGILDLSARANLQIRGVSDATLPGLADALADLGLLDEAPEAEAVRNVLASPLAGLDPAALLDIRPVTRTLEARLVSDRALHALPTKFGFLIDDGGSLGLAEVAADIRFDAVAGPLGPLFRVSLGGTAADARAVGLCAPGEVPEVAAGLARAFLGHRGTGPDAPRRMRDLIATGAPFPSLAGLPSPPARSNGPEDWIGLVQTGPTLFNPSPRWGEVARAERRAGEGVPPSPDSALPLTPALSPLGRGGASAPGCSIRGSLAVLGVGAPFGRLGAKALELLARQAGRADASEIRLTPWRSLLVPGLHADRVPAMLDALALHFITRAGDPRLAVAACAGAPGCRRATTPVHDDATMLAPAARALATQGIALHLSGCAKGCAHPGPSRATLVGEAGRYGLVVDGTAQSQPVLQGLTLAGAIAALQDLGRFDGAGA